MPGSTPLLGISYPLAVDPPQGHTQMETITRGLEKFACIPVADEAERDSLLTGGTLHEGTLAYIEGNNELQIRLAGQWKIILNDDEMNTDLKDSLGSASGQKGRVRMRDSDNTLWFSDGSAWNRLIDATEVRSVGGASSLAAVNTSSAAGTTNPSGGDGINCDVVLPPSKKLVITVCAQMRVDNNVGEAYANWEVWYGGSRIEDANVQRGCRTDRETTGSYSWTSKTGVAGGGASEGDTVNVRFVHQVNSSSRTAYYTSREITALPVK